ncbi:hypothetical protein EVAR_67620_1 [Eumeta japonica]|uniref:Uncharacterized protein n=1 Tax=Eumeta variegata TaxID=151549 RepID=A0A4C1ST03_EUMVA|nr:hypothetical protein EVAR_67620_1 [Eumeta japonica]
MNIHKTKVELKVHVVSTLTIIENSRIQVADEFVYLGQPDYRLEALDVATGRLVFGISLRDKIRNECILTEICVNDIAHKNRGCEVAISFVKPIIAGEERFLSDDRGMDVASLRATASL